MKKILLILLPLLIVLPIFANEITTDKSKNTVPTFSIEDEDIAKVAVNETTAEEKFDAQVFRQKKKITDSLLWSSAAVSSVGITVLTASIVMGFIPQSEFPSEMFTDVAFQIKHVGKNGREIISSYPPMMVYCCVGAALFCAGTLILLFALPVLFYSIIRKVNEYKFEKAIKKESRWDISMSGVQFKF